MHKLNLPTIKAKAPEINMSSLVDVVFLLLIFFMVTTVFPDNDGIIIEKPTAEHAVSLTDKNIVVKIDSLGDVYIHNKPVTIKDLKRLLKNELAINKNTAVILQADKQTKTEALIKVIDAAKTSGAKQLGLATDEKPI